jgi:hypothetical protein
MKKLLIITNLFWVSIFVFWSCFPSRNTYRENNCETFCYNFKEVPFPGLSYKAAQILAANYKQNHYQTINNGLNITDSRSVWFSLQTIKTFIYQIESSSCKNRCNSTVEDSLGVRFYFGEYPANVASDPLFTGVPNNYSGLHTLFMMPTYKDPVLGNVDFDPIYNAKFNKGNCSPQTLKNYVVTQKLNETSRLMQATSYMVTAAIPDADGSQNHGPLCPPDNCNSAFQ